MRSRDGVCMHPRTHARMHAACVQVFLTDTHLGIVMEYASGGELFDRIVQAGRFLEDEARYFFQQLISGVHHCHCSVGRAAPPLGGGGHSERPGGRAARATCRRVPRVDSPVPVSSHAGCACAWPPPLADRCLTAPARPASCRACATAT